MQTSSFPSSLILSTTHLSNKPLSTNRSKCPSSNYMFRSVLSYSHMHNQDVYFGSSKSFFLCNYLLHQHTFSIFTEKEEKKKGISGGVGGWGHIYKSSLLLTKTFQDISFSLCFRKQSDNNKIFCNFHFSVKTKQGQMLKQLAFKGFVIGYLLLSELSQWYQDTTFKGSVRVHVWAGVGGCTQNNDRRSWLAAK